MITNAVCTVVRQADDGSFFIVNPEPHECMWQETEAVEIKKYGAENADKAAIYIPDTSADVRKEDHICRGTVKGEIDLSEMLTVVSVTPYDYGSPEMRHIKVGAR